MCDRYRLQPDCALVIVVFLVIIFRPMRPQKQEFHPKKTTSVDSFSRTTTGTPRMFRASERARESSDSDAFVRRDIPPAREDAIRARLVRLLDP